MKTVKPYFILFISFLLITSVTQNTFAQTFSLDNNASTLKIEGTSNLHDWTIEAKDQQGKLTAQVVDGQLVKINELNFVVKAESLKSGKSGMDKNTYKALNTNKHQQIVFKLTNVNNIDCVTQGNCKVTASGNLTINGNTRSINVIFDVKVTANSISIAGSEELLMTQYKVDPPTAMFGTITTGDKVEVLFKSTFKK